MPSSDYAHLSDRDVAALVAWMVSMTSRQAGHFFFEPKGYDVINQAKHSFQQSKRKFPAAGTPE